jgi:simple sugar transport system permease protein
VDERGNLVIGLNIVKGQPLPRWAKVLLPVAAIVAALAIGALPVILAGGNLLKAYSALVYGSLGTRFNFLETLVKASPLILTGLAVSFAFRARFWNIGAEGQLFAGAVAATAVGVYCTWLPSFLVVPGCILAGFIAGGLWAAIPAFLKTRLRVDDVVTTLLMNYVMIHIMGALLYGPMQAAGSSWPRSEPIMEAAHYPVLLERSRLHLGFPLAIALVLVVWFINTKTVFGYRAKCVGVNIDAARFSGIDTGATILGTALVSGGLAGLAGVGEVCAIHFHLLMDISPGYGYTGIVIAMLGNLHPLGVALSAFFFSCLSVGSQTMSRMAGIPVYIEGVIEGIALTVMLISILFMEYRIRWTRK